MTDRSMEDPGASVRMASRTDVGLVRSANEDSFGQFGKDSDGARLLVVADGMGGHRGGATASQTAVATIGQVFQESMGSTRNEDLLRQAIEAANARIFEMATADPELEGMGTTVVAFLLDESRRGFVAHVGDSRAYRYRQGRLEPLTTDHSVVAEMHRRGMISVEEAASHPRRNEILRSVGVLPEVAVEAGQVDVAAGDRIILCSDGLSGVLRDEEMAAVIQSELPEDAVDTLVRLANERGGPDNITVQVLLVPAGPTEGDPEATAPVELSEVGLRAIESRRRSRQRARRIGLTLAVAALLGALYLVWQLSEGRSAGEPAELRAPGATEPRQGVPR